MFLIVALISQKKSSSPKIFKNSYISDFHSKIKRFCTFLIQKIPKIPQNSKSRFPIPKDYSQHILRKKIQIGSASFVLF